MLIFHRLRNVVNRAMSPLGFALVRVEKQPWFRPAVADVQIGRFNIQIPTINPLAHVYQKNTSYTGHLGRLTALFKTKYPVCSAMDIGANVGDTACIIKSAADIPLLCVEGDDSSFQFLKKNVRQLNNVSIYKLFLGEKSETVAVNITKQGWNTTLLPGNDNAAASQRINLMSLDDFLTREPLPAMLKLLKVDTEGFDCSILRGAKKTLRQYQPVISFEYNRDNMMALGENGLDTLAMLGDLGYDQVAFHDCDGRFFDFASLSDGDAIRNIHDYADGKHAAVYYFDLTLFHQADNDLAAAFMANEKSFRNTGSIV